MANSGLQALLCGIALCGPASVAAETDTDDEELPDMEFLEYLGLWEESDDEWLLLDKEAAADNDERSDPVPKGEESTETEDES